MTDILTYYNTLKEAYETDKLYLSRNTDTAHNAMIMRLMLEKSTKIYIYCGKMSVFRRDFYDGLTASNLPGEEIKSLVVEALNNFLKRKNSALEIILESECDYSNLDDLIVDAREFRKKANIYYLPDSIKNKSQLKHFSFSGDEKVVRIETDKSQREAICKIGLDSHLPSPLSNFKDLRSIAIPLSI